MGTPADRTAVESRLPKGRTLPDEFKHFAFAVRHAGLTNGFLELQWTDARRLMSLKASALRDILPFLRLGDGGCIALWWESDRAVRVISATSEGQYDVIAETFPDFLQRMTRRKTTVYDVDCAKRPLSFSKVRLPRGRLRPVSGASRKAFQAWIKKHSALVGPAQGIEASALRRNLMSVARAMLKDGLSRVYNLRSYWRMTFRLTRTGDGFHLEYRDYGEWHEVPPKYGLAELVPSVVALVKHPNRERYEMSVGKSGLVAVDREKELLLAP